MGIVLIDKMIKKKKVTLHKTQKTVVSNYTSLYDCKFHSTFPVISLLYASEALKKIIFDFYRRVGVCMVNQGFIC